MKGFTQNISFNIGWYEATTIGIDHERTLLRLLGPGNNWTPKAPPRNYDRAYEITPGRTILVSKLLNRIIVNMTDEGCDHFQKDANIEGLDDWLSVFKTLDSLGLHMRRLDLQLDDHSHLIPFDHYYDMPRPDLLSSVVTGYRHVSRYDGMHGKTIYFGAIGASQGSKRNRRARSGIRLYRRDDKAFTRIELQLGEEESREAMKQLLRNGSSAIRALIMGKIRFIEEPLHGREKYDAKNAPWYDRVFASTAPVKMGLYKGNRAQDEFKRASQFLSRNAKTLRKILLHPAYGEKFILGIARNENIKLDSSTQRQLDYIRKSYRV